MRVEVAVEQFALFGEVGQRLHSVADGVARRLVPGDDEQDEERAKLLRRQLFAVDDSSHHCRRDVVLRVGAAALAQGLGVGEHLERVRHQVVV